VPLPGETSLIAAGALSAQHGSISIATMIAIAAAAIAGDNIGLKGAIIRVCSCGGSVVLVDESAEPVVATDLTHGRSCA
jgi:hypothetical protein